VSGNRDEIERVKRNMRFEDQARRLEEGLRLWEGSDEDRAIARAELDAEANRDGLEGQPEMGAAADSDDRITYEGLEAKRRAYSGATRTGHRRLACRSQTCAMRRRRIRTWSEIGTPVPGRYPVDVSTPAPLILGRHESDLRPASRGHCRPAT
jgi:hypothetical protein